MFLNAFSKSHIDSRQAVWASGSRRINCKKGTRELFSMTEMYSILTVTVVTICFKWVHFIIRKLCL